MTDQDHTEARGPSAERILIGFLYGLVIFICLTVYLYQPLRIHGVDYTKHWEALREFMHGRSPYVGGLYMGFNYPLFTLIPSLYLYWVDVQTGETLWDIANFLYVILGALIAALLIRPIPLRQETPGEELHPKARVIRFTAAQYWTILSLLTVALYQPLQAVCYAGNIDPLSFVLLMAATALAIRKKDTPAGILFAAGALVKLAPIFLIPALLAARKRKMAVAALATLLSYALLLLVTGLWKVEAFLYTDVLHRIPFFWKHISHSPHYLVCRWIFPSALNDEALFRQIVLAVNVFLLAGYLVVCLVYFLRKRPAPLDGILSYGFFMLLLLTPLLEINHYVWIAPGMFLQLRAWTQGRLSHAWLPFLAVGWIGILFMKDYLMVLGWFRPDVFHHWVQTAFALYATTVAGLAAFHFQPEEAG